jgi:hypothetical protein
MARLISQTGLTANTTIGSPQEGTKWIVKWAVLFLITSSTTGNRSAYLFVKRANNAYLSGPLLGGINPTTGTSTVIVSASEGSTQYYGGGFPLAIFNSLYQFIEVYAVDTIQLVVSLQSGDSVDYYILVEEAPS